MSDDQTSRHLVNIFYILITKMGAGCSSSAKKKYNDLKNYLNSHECMTFDVIHGFVSNSSRPPVILIGENHLVNDSLFGSQSCVTSFSAMSKIVSKCKDPSANVHFVVEKTGSIFAETRSMKSMKDDSVFNLIGIWDKDERHSHLWSSGLSVVPFDMFSETRRLFLSREWRKNLTISDVFAIMSSEMMQVLTRMGMGMPIALTKMLLEKNAPASTLHNISEPELRMSMDEVRKLLEICLRRMLTEIGTYSEGVYKGWAEEEAKARQIALYRRRLMEEDLLANFLEGGDKQPRWNEKEIHDNIPVFRPWMLQVVYCIYLFTLKILEPKMSKLEREVFETSGVKPRLDMDLLFATRVTELLFEKVIRSPNLHQMFTFVTRCGDFITYGLYLRDKLMKQNTRGDIYVVYGGSRHTLTLSALIKHLPDHRLDLSRVSRRLCKGSSDEDTKWLCNDIPDVTAEEFVRML